MELLKHLRLYQNQSVDIARVRTRLDVASTMHSSSYVDNSHSLGYSIPGFFGNHLSIWQGDSSEFLGHYLDWTRAIGRGSNVCLLPLFLSASEQANQYFPGLGYLLLERSLHDVLLHIHFHGLHCRTHRTVHVPTSRLFEPF